MPVDFYNEIIYEFPYETLIEIIKSKYSSEPALVSYLDEWNNALRFIENFRNRDYTKFRKKNDTYKKENKCFECFVYNQTFPEVNANYIIHFDIDKINCKNKSKPKIKRTKRLIEILNYNEDEECHKYPSILPVIIVPYISLDNNLLLIDGNKRLATNLKYHIPFTRFTIYYPMDIEDFGFAIDWAFYWFFFDVNSHFNNRILLCEWFQKQIKELSSEITEY